MDQAKTVMIENYLSSIFHTRAQVQSIEQLGNGKVKELKSFGYGKPYLIRCVAGDEPLELVLESMNENSFGHDHFSDRAQSLLWYHSAANHLPGHARSFDVGAFTKDQNIVSVGNAEEFFVLNEFVRGSEYAMDLQRIQTTDRLEPLDVQRVEALASYLSEIHALKQNRPELYIRRIRDLLGHGECIMGLIDNYPQNDSVVSQETLYEIEVNCVTWRWKLKKMTHRLSQVHGDFHPWNVLFQTGTDFRVLDRSRGEWGEPADDIASMTINYILHSLQTYGHLDSIFQEMFLKFWETYLNSSKDMEVLNTVQPFYAWRALVLLNPVWYPCLRTQVRQKLLQFIKNVLSINKIDPQRIKELF